MRMKCGGAGERRPGTGSPSSGWASGRDLHKQEPGKKGGVGREGGVIEREKPAGGQREGDGGAGGSVGGLYLEPGPPFVVHCSCSEVKTVGGFPPHPSPHLAQASQLLLPSLQTGSPP